MSDGCTGLLLWARGSAACYDSLPPQQTHGAWHLTAALRALPCLPLLACPLMTQVSFRNRFLILIDWLKAQVFGRDLSQF